MKTRLINGWYWLRGSFWFIPALMVCLSILIAYITGRLNMLVFQDDTFTSWWIYSGEPEGARAVLSTIAESMITVAGVVFSITIVVLSLASSQYGPRLIRNFMNDRGNQIVLGIFLSTFMYCLVTLRQIQKMKESILVPHISVTVGVLMAMAGLGVLIYFIHHISASIQANNLLAAVGRDLENSISRLFPEKLGRTADMNMENQQIVNNVPADFEENAVAVHSDRSGYLQMISLEGLMNTAKSNDLLVHLHYRPGRFIIEGAVVVKVWPEKNVSEGLSGEINESLILGTERTQTQDVEYAFDLLSETALRALSPSINDPYTALSCIDWIGSGLSKLCERQMPSRYGMTMTKH